MATVATGLAVAVQTVEMASRSAVVGLEVEGSQGLVAVDPAGQVGRVAVAQVAEAPVAMVRGGKDVAVVLAAADHLLPRTRILFAYRDSKCDTSSGLKGALELLSCWPPPCFT